MNKDITDEFFKDIKLRYGEFIKTLDYEFIGFNRLHIHLIKIPSKLRNRGFGSTIMREIIEHCKTNRLTLTLFIFPYNTAKLKNFYSRLGLIEHCDKLNNTYFSNSNKPVL